MKRSRSPAPQREVSLASVEPLNLDELASSLDLSEDTCKSLFSLIDAWDHSTPRAPSPPRHAVCTESTRPQSSGQSSGQQRQPPAPRNAAPMLWKNICKLWDDLLSNSPFAAVTAACADKKAEKEEKREERVQDAQKERHHLQSVVRRTDGGNDILARGDVAMQESGVAGGKEEVAHMSIDEACAKVSEFFDMDLDERDVELFTDDGLLDVSSLISPESQQRVAQLQHVTEEEEEEEEEEEGEDVAERMPMPVARKLDFRDVAEPAQRRCITRDPVVDRRLGYQQIVQCRLKSALDKGGRRVEDASSDREMRRRRMVEEQRRLSRNLRTAKLGDVPRNTKLPPFNRGGRRQEGGGVRVRRVVKVSGTESPTDITRWR